MTRRTRVTRFLVVGGLGIVVQFAILEALAEVAGVPYLIATMAAVGGAVVHNFLWHRQWTWRDRSERGMAAFVKFTVANGAVSFVGNVILMAVLVSGAGLNLMIANAFAIAVCGVANYWLADAFAFAKLNIVIG